MYDVSAQGVDERMVDVHYYYYESIFQSCSALLSSLVLCYQVQSILTRP